MLDELDEFRLTVELIPSKHREIAERGGMIRCATMGNPGWYQRLCARHLSSRKRKNRLPDTRVRRVNIISILTGMSLTGKPSSSQYTKELLRIAEGYNNVLPPREDAPF